MKSLLKNSSQAHLYPDYHHVLFLLVPSQRLVLIGHAMLTESHRPSSKLIQKPRPTRIDTIQLMNPFLPFILLSFSKRKSANFLMTIPIFNFKTTEACQNRFHQQTCSDGAMRCPTSPIVNLSLSHHPTPKTDIKVLKNFQQLFHLLIVRANERGGQHQRHH